jgi:tetratricopeptide (TPR) repeat protein
MSVNKNIILLIMIALIFCGCPSSDSNVEPPAATYDDLVSDGWSEFTSQNYTVAIEKFDAAKSMEPDIFEAYNGLGWTYFKDDQLANSIIEFSSGSQKVGSTADIEAGWAFVLNADKKYAASNIKIDTALTSDSNWIFSHGLGLNKNDLIVLKAENFFLLGSFAVSLSAIQELNPSFVANILTSEGRADLALEIERLKGVN